MNHQKLEQWLRARGYEEGSTGDRCANWLFTEKWQIRLKRKAADPNDDQLLIFESRNITPDTIIDLERLAL